jgi:hypothetical protein
MIPAAAKLRAPLAALGVASALAVAPTAAHADQYGNSRTILVRVR